MNIFETVKAAVPVRQAAEHYGLKVSRNGMACCPFHNDRHSSLKLNEEYFFCFGCGAKGDVIDFAAQMFDLSSYEAAQRLTADFGISTQPGQAVVVPHKPKRPHIRQFREDEMFCFRVLTDYLHLLEDWKVRYAIRQAIRELEQAGYIQRSRERDEKGRLRGADYVIFELPQPVPASVSPTLENPTLENPTQENPTLENPMQLNKDKLITEKQKKEEQNTDSIPIHSPNPLPLDEDETAAPPPERTENRKEAAYQIYRDLILENIEYDTLTQNPRIDRDQLDEIVDILLETVCTSRKSIRIAGDDYPAELVKAKFLKLDSHHIEFVMDCLRDNTTKVRNIKQYLRAMLFNAPSTINSYYASLVAHDMAQPDWGRPPNT